MADEQGKSGNNEEQPKAVNPPPAQQSKPPADPKANAKPRWLLEQEEKRKGTQ